MTVGGSPVDRGMRSPWAVLRNRAEVVHMQNSELGGTPADAKQRADRYRILRQ